MSNADGDVNIKNWQLVTTKSTKKRPNASGAHETKKLKTDERTHVSRGKSNSFSLLSEEEELIDSDRENAERNIAAEEERVPKPPPIFIPGVRDIKTMSYKFISVIPRDDFCYKSQNDGQVKVMVKNIDSYRKLIKHLNTSEIVYHTYQIKQEKAYRVVIKNLHFSTDTADIISELNKHGHDVRNIINIKSRVTKEPLSMFFVDLEPKESNKDVFKIQFICNALIKIEQPKKFDDLVQCHRCQEFGHTKSYCHKAFKCVKCGLGHASSLCTKPKDSPPQCTHCLLRHTASYKGCAVYQSILAKQNKQTRINSRYNNPNPFMHNAETCFSNTAGQKTSYADMVKSDDTKHSSIKKLEDMMAKQVELINSLIKMMSTLMSQLCK